MARKKKRLPRKGTQLHLIPAPKKVFGGSLLKGNAKEERPISTKHFMHLVLRSSLAKGRRSFLHDKNWRKVNRIVREQAGSAGIKIKHFENVGNHLHIVVLIPSRKALFRFLRSISGIIARFIMGAERNNPKTVKFWDARPFSRIVAWGERSLRPLKEYMHKNREQALGFSFRGNTPRFEFSSA